jgi:hypothetical protein
LKIRAKQPNQLGLFPLEIFFKRDTIIIIKNYYKFGFIRMVYMKKLMIMVCLSFMGMIISSEEFPHIKSHFPTESLLRQQCEENERIESPNDEQLQGIFVCKNVDNMFPFLTQQIRASYKKSLNLRRLDRPALQIAVREEMKKRLSTKKYAQEEISIIEAILGHRELSQIDKRKEYGFLRGFYVMAAEEGLRD